MSGQDELRDRIADLLWRTEEKSWEDQAQAIIDEFGLTVETVVNLGNLPEHLQGVFMDDPEFREWRAKQPRESRVVGKWED